jgi:eukaryotic-like serine/threonine-protein kinase
MSSEQAQGAPADARSDIFRFGVVLYEMLTGRRAFTGDTAVGILAAVLYKEPAPVEGTPALGRVAARCMPKVPSDRYQSATELRTALSEEEILNALTQLPGLRVVARASAFAFRGREHAIKQIGETLKVSSVLHGSVRRSGNRIRINVQLIKVDDESQLWSERYDRQMRDVFDIQD